MYTGCTVSCIVFARIRAAICTIFAICVYVPHLGHINPTRADILAELDVLLASVSPVDCTVTLGHLTIRYYLDHMERLTGRWCVHKRGDNHGGGVAILDLMKNHNLLAASTIHQPCRGHTNATFIPRAPNTQATSN